MTMFIPFEDQPPSMQNVVMVIREQMLTQLAQQEQQRLQSEAKNEELRRIMTLKMKRRVRKAQKRGR